MERLKGRAYSDAKDFKRASVAVFELTGRHGKVKSLVSERVFWAGAGHLMITGQRKVRN